MEKGGRELFHDFAGLKFFRIKTFLEFSTAINVEAILGRTHLRCSGKKVFLKIAAPK